MVPPNAPIVTTYTPVVSQTLDRWGNVLSVSMPFNQGTAAASQRLTQYRYNYLNQVIEEVKPETDIWTANGVNLRTDINTTNDRPTTRYYYDAQGLAIGTIDPNGYVQKQQYDAAGQLIAEYHPDGGVVKTIYDAFGRKTAVIDANDYATRYIYDRADRLIREELPRDNTNYTAMLYTYDAAGNRITVTNGEGETTRYFYDTRGNLVMTRLPMGGADVNTRYYTAATYDARGHKIAEGNSLVDIQTWSYDYFGRFKPVNGHRDLGGVSYGYTYDRLGQLIAQTSTARAPNIQGQALRYSYYANGLMKTVTDDILRRETSYEYDLAGNRTRERFVNLTTNTVYQDIHLLYDELNRLKEIKDNRYDLQYFYDAAGNRRQVYSRYFDNTGAQKTQDYWYLYDSLNRITLSQGVRQNGQIVITADTGTGASLIKGQGIELQYDAASNRRTAHFFEGAAEVFEAYNYDALNRLTNTNSGPNGGQLTSVRTYDRAGRLTEYASYSSPGTLKDRQKSYYNANGWMTKQESFNGSNVITQRLNYDYADSYDAVGNVLKYSIAVLSGTGYTNTYTKEYAKYDGYKEKVVHGASTYFSPGNTTLTYDVNGNLTKVVDQFQTNKTRDFIVNTQGQILQKLENGKTQYYYYANNNPVGNVGDLSSASFDYNYTPVSDQYPASTPSSYVVNQGDTLQGIALAVYGDSKLWYLIADANGLAGDADLKAGQALVIPNKITNLHNDHTVYKPYNPGEIIGDTTPTLPDPPPPPPPPSQGKHGCGGFAMILIIIVAIVVTVFTAGAALAVIAPAGSAAAGVAAGGAWAAGTAALAGATTAGVSLGWAGVAAAMIGGAVGSIASQLVGIGLGAQEKFSWRSVAVSALGAGVTSGLGTVGQGGVAEQVFGATAKNSHYMNAAINGMVSNAASQGVGILTGQQQKFDWKGMAFAGASAAGQAYLKNEFNIGGTDSQRARQFSWGEIATETGKGIVKGAVVQAFNNHGKVDWQKVGADAFGNALANSIVGAMRWSEQQEQIGAADRERVRKTADRFLQQRRDMANDDQRKDAAYAPFGTDPETRNRSQNLVDQVTGATASDWDLPPTVQEGDKLAWASKYGFTAHQDGTRDVIKDEWEGQYNVYDRAHAAIDSDEFQDSKYSFMHSMRDEGTGQSDPAARELANHWMRYNMQSAMEYRANGDFESAAFHEGLALHTIQDSTSPSHVSGESGELRPWHNQEGPLDLAKHVTRELLYPGRDSYMAAATQGIHQMVQQGYIPSGDLIKRFGVDSPTLTPL